MIAFRWGDTEKRTCYVRGVEYQHNLFNSGILNPEKTSKYSAIGAQTYINFDELPDIVRARVTMLTLAKDEEYIESVGFNGEIDTATADYMYIYEEE